ncbi:bifunctional phosphoribosylaminoimidazolecarboxamide formyltransferase/IMP cyclohydrolase [bacterium]|nr:bifunctional phosphoribosylaminoimidazolecarboxamide formyltransferase/IMP cyclohydrolase [bacterium]
MRALISVSDKEGIVEFAKELAKLNVEILSTGGTAKILRENGVVTKDVSDFTNFPEMLDGRVKTLHPKIHGGILAIRSNPEHLEQAAKNGIDFIDLVVVNLYPFEQTIKKTNVTFAEAIENIDIGGPTMLRSAAKNHEFVTVVVNPKDYAKVLGELKINGNTTPETRIELAKEVFNHTARYDSLIANFFNQKCEEGVPKQFNLSLKLESSLRYGENPHQKAALYGNFFEVLQQQHGKELSFNNINDANAAVNLIREFEEPTAAILKHTNPCGVGTGKTLFEAYTKAFSTDTKSPFGGVVVFNGTLDLETAKEVSKIFTELIIAPDFEKDAFEHLSKKKNVRILKLNFSAINPKELDLKRVANGILVQENDLESDSENDWKVVTAKKPGENEMQGLKFAWKIVKHVKSNAIVYAENGRTLGIGAGQMSRVDSAKTGVSKAFDENHSLKGAVLASDAFFPFRDGVEEAAKQGITAIIQPGGSVKDDEVIQAANDYGIAMIFTGKRHFRH